MPKDHRTIHPRAYRRTWLVAFLGFFLLGGAWAIATPYDGAPDEGDHILRAYGIATGQILLAPADAALGGGAFVDAPRSLVVDRCWQFHPELNAACSGSPGADRTVESAPTSAGRTLPVYYALVGAPLALSPDWTGVLLARLLSVAATALLLATALADAARWSRHRLMVAGVAAATTPMVMHLAGSVNPSSVEIAASVALFAAAVPLFHHPAARRDVLLLRHLGIAAALVASTRMLGPLWVAIALVLVLPWRRTALRNLWAWRPLRWWAVAATAAAVAGVVWTLLSKGAAANSYFQPDEQLAAGRIAWSELQTWGRYVDEMIGVFSWLDTRMPELGYLVWLVVGGSLALSGYVAAHRTGRIRILALAGAGVLVPLSISVMLANTFGFITQGRYLLPLLVGVPILAAFQLGRQLWPPDRARSVLRVVAFTLPPVHLAALAFAMQRWQLGQGISAGFDLLGAPWRPPLGPVLPLVAGAAGVALLGWLVARGQPAASPRDDREEATGPAARHRRSGESPRHSLSTDIRYASLRDSSG